MISLDYYHPSSATNSARSFTFHQPVLANETLSVSLRREIDNIFGAVRRCFDHVLSKFSGFSRERTGVFYFYSLHVSIW